MHRFTSKRGLVIFLCACMIWTQAFSCKSALAELQNWAPVVLNGFAGVVSIINPPAGSALAIAAGLVPKLWGDATAAMNTYASSNTSGNLQALIAALNAVNAQWNQVMTDIGQTGGNAQNIQTAKAALTVLIVTLDSIEAKLEPLQVSTTAAASRVAIYTHASLPIPQLNGVSVVVTPATSGAQLKSQLNHIFIAGGHSELKLK